MKATVGSYKCRGKRNFFGTTRTPRRGLSCRVRAESGRMGLSNKVDQKGNDYGFGLEQDRGVLGVAC